MSPLDANSFGCCSSLPRLRTDHNEPRTIVSGVLDDHRLLRARLYRAPLTACAALADGSSAYTIAEYMRSAKSQLMTFMNAST